MVQFVVLLICILHHIINIKAFYLPGVAPREYGDGDLLGVKVVKLDSSKTQLPYDYYSLPFCKPTIIEQTNENLGEILSGDRIENSLYDVSVKNPYSCKLVCKRQYSDAELQQFSDMIENEYRVNWLLDNIPAATTYYTSAVRDTNTDSNSAELSSNSNNMQYIAHYEKGYALGFIGHSDMTGSEAGVKYINNHLRLIIFYHEEPGTFHGSRIVGFEVQAYSIKHEFDINKINDLNYKPSSCNVNGQNQNTPIVPQRVSDINDPNDKNIIFSYDVEWQSSDIKWASRWDIFLTMNDSKIHWFSIINSIMIVLFLSGMLAVIMIRILHRDLARYNELNQLDDSNANELNEETGWKLIHGDVFRPPKNGQWFSVLVGTGVQVFSMTLITLLFAAFGFLSPANRGGLMTAVLMLFVFSGVFSGYYSTKTYKMFQLQSWKRNTLITALFFPGIVFTIFFALNLLVWSQKSSGAVPFTTLCSLLVLWLGISLPLVYLGSYISYKQAAVEHPTKINNLSRLLPVENQYWYNNSVLTILLGGILPFAAVFIEIFFIMSSVWKNEYYYIFGFLFLVFIILIITCAEISIVLIYFQLCSENHYWWWKSYLTSGSSALYLFTYSILYFCTKLQITSMVSAVLYFGYMFLVSLLFFVLTGTIGYISCFYFITKIYSSIKVD